MSWESILPFGWETNIEGWLKEDAPSFDYGGFVVGLKQDKAEILCKANGVLCGVPFVTKIFETLGCKVEWHVKEGDPIDVSKGNIQVAHVTGPASRILLGERVALNLMARASGIATRARHVHDLAVKASWHGKVAGTRKTTPGFRIVEKYAILVGGADTHRYDLSSMVMLKDNHVASTGSITAAVKKARSVAGFSVKIEVECQNQQEAEEAITAGADIVMLDNHKPEQLKISAKNLKEKYPHIFIEGSGGVTVNTVENYFSPYVDVVSMGSLTQGVPHIDFSLNILSTSFHKT